MRLHISPAASPSMCGAVMATIEELAESAETHSQNVQSIVSRIRPAVEPLFATEIRHQPDKLLEAAIRANILAAANHLRHGSQTLERLMQLGKPDIVAAEYSLESGEVRYGGCFSGYQTAIVLPAGLNSPPAP